MQAMFTRCSPPNFEFSDYENSASEMRIMCPIIVGVDQLTDFLDPEVPKVGYEWELVEFDGEIPKNETRKTCKTQKACLQEFGENFILSEEVELLITCSL